MVTVKFFPSNFAFREFHYSRKSHILLSNPRRWSSNSSKGLNKTALYEFHANNATRVEPFAGYLMPIVYRNQTIKSEHIHTRNSTSVFDVSHMMQTRITGRDRHKFLERLTVADVTNLKLNQCSLSVFTNEHGGIIDDCIISQREDYIHLVSNAGNADIVWKWLSKNLDSGLDATVEKLEQSSLIALQGPSSARILQTLVDADLSKIKFMNVVDTLVKNIGLCQVARCGYTGEDGFEISVASNLALTLMELLCQQEGVKPAGLGSRDTLRLEAGLCLHGHDITDKTTPVEAGLNWTVHKRRREVGGFLGSTIILEQLKNGSATKRIGLAAVDSGPPAREGSEVTDMEGTCIGTITSGTFSPVLEKNIGMAYLPTSFLKTKDDMVKCVIRGKSFLYKITKMPFVKSNYYS